jgi:hypothetical protein
MLLLLLLPAQHAACIIFVHTCVFLQLQAQVVSDKPSMLEGDESAFYCGVHDSCEWWSAGMRQVCRQEL